jgi:hypothetical protein
MRSVGLLSVIGLGLGVLALAPGDAAAQDARSGAAAALFAEGQQLQVQGKTAEACRKFEESQAASAAIGTLLELTWCYEQDGWIVRAWQAAVQAEKLAKTKKDSRAAGARTRVTELEKRLPRLEIRAVGAPAGLAISLDGAAYDVALLGIAVPLELGAHRVIATAPDHDRFERTVDLAEGATSTVEITMTKTVVPVEPDPIVTEPVKDPAPDPAKKTITEKPRTSGSPPPDRPGQGRRLVGLVSGGVGALVLGGAGALAFMAKSEYDGAFDDGHCDRETLGCDAAGEETTARARTKAHVATVVGVVGIAAVAAGVILYLTAPGAAPERERARSSYLVPVVGDGAVGLAFGGSL